MPLPSSPSELAALQARLRIALTPGFGRGLQRRLDRNLGTPLQVLASPPERIAQALAEGEPCADLDRATAQRGPASLAKSLLAHDTHRDARVACTLAWAQADGHHLLAPELPGWPARLSESPDPPALLHVHGDPACLSRPAVAIVGARHATRAGTELARDFARALGEAGLTVVSGLARGIDAAAHEGALATPAGTLAVIGTGPDIVYPAGHAGLQARIAQTGAVISELPPGTEARAHHFPQRNRLIAALPLGVLVVEAARASGSLITARLALEAGREVMALPGSIHAPLSRGCHQLIREGAALVEDVHDVLRALGLPDGGPTTEPPAPALPDGPAGRLLEALAHDPQSADLLSVRSGLAMAELGVALCLLELDGQVERLADGRWNRVARLAPR